MADSFNDIAFGSDNMTSIEVTRRYGSLETRIRSIERSGVIPKFRKGLPLPAKTQKAKGNPTVLVPYVSQVIVTQTGTAVQNKTMALVSVQFNAPADQRNWAAAHIAVKGYKGNPNWVFVNDSNQSPSSFLLEATGEIVVFAVGSISPTGQVNDITKAPTSSISLDGVTGAPPAPSIAQKTQAITIGGTTNGWQFQFNYIQGLVSDVIDGYWIYRTSAHTSPSDPTARYKYVKQSATQGSIYTFQDVTGSATQFYYWISAVNTAGLESAIVDAGAVVVTIYRPSTNTAIQNGGFQLPGKAYDGSTASAASATRSSAAQGTVTTSWKGFSAAVGSPTAINLKVVFSVINSSGSLSRNATVRYSLNNGASFTNIFSGTGPKSAITATIPLSTAQSLTAMQLQAFATYNSSSTGGLQLNIFEIWIEVST